VGLDSVASLVVASLDLQVVRLLRDAIRTTELSDNRRRGPLDAAGVPAEVPRPVEHIHPVPVVEPVEHIHPQPILEPRRVIHQRPEVLPPDAAVCPPCCTGAFVDPCAKSPIEPPWKVLPWDPRGGCAPLSPPPAKVVKRVIRPPDIVHKGTLIDFFI
jgi:hypothetical protein